MKYVNTILFLGTILLLLVSFKVMTPSLSETSSLRHDDTVPAISLIQEVTGTYYHTDESQCDDNPFITADQSEIDSVKLKRGELRWVALSRDLLKRWKGPINYGDTIYIHHSNDELRGNWIVHDCMNAKYENRIDFLAHPGKKFPDCSGPMLISDATFLNRWMKLRDEYTPEMIHDMRQPCTNMYETKTVEELLEENEHLKEENEELFNKIKHLINFKEDVEDYFTSINNTLKLLNREL